MKYLQFWPCNEKNKVKEEAKLLYRCTYPLLLSLLALLCYMSTLLDKQCIIVWSKNGFK